MSTRLRMTLIYEFDYIGEVDENVANRLAENFFADPTGFVHPMECDEQVIISIENTQTEEEYTDVFDVWP